MKRTPISLSALLVLSALFTLTSCQKEEASDGTQFRASMEDCTSLNGKTTLSGTALNWVSGDRIAVYGTAGCGIYSATPQTPATTAVLNNISGTPGSAPFRAIYPTTLTTDGVNVTLPSTQTYVESPNHEVSIHEFPMYAESNNNSLSFRNLCGALKLNLTKAGVNISTIAVTVPTPNPVINGTFSVSLDAEGNPQLTPVSGSTTTTLTCATAQSIAGGKDFFIYLPAGEYTGLRIELNTDDGRYCVKTANTTISVTRSHYTLITLGESNLNFVEPLPQGALPGLFSISATQQVRFSQGNLQYQASTDTWRFAEHQYDFVGDATHGNVYENEIKCNNSLISTSYSGWIDLFGWGTGNNPTMTTTNNSAYSSFVDWGTNAISNGGDQVNLWRTLTSAEWYYLQHSRPGANTKYGTGNVNGIGGVIILPDSWELPANCNFTPGVSSTYGDWTHNSYTLTQWASMESNGAIFIPACGFRSGTSIDFLCDRGYIWTSSVYTPDNRFAYYLYFSSITVVNDPSNRSYARTVRLVQDYD